MSSVTLTIDDRFIPFMISGGLILLSFICCFNMWIKALSAIFLFIRACCIKIRSFLMLYLLTAAVAVPCYKYLNINQLPHSISLPEAIFGVCFATAVIMTILIILLIYFDKDSDAKA